MPQIKVGTGDFLQIFINTILPSLQRVTEHKLNNCELCVLFA